MGRRSTDTVKQYLARLETHEEGYRARRSSIHIG